jgi:hypothetical protein
MVSKCPGQDQRFWKPEDISLMPCPRCGVMVEFFKDDSSRKCPDCGTRFKNPHLDMGCAQWCPFAKDCIDYQNAEE